jgi:hypothetical protein
MRPAVLLNQPVQSVAEATKSVLKAGPNYRSCRSWPMVGPGSANMQNTDGICTVFDESAVEAWAALEVGVHRLKIDFRGLEN